MAAQSVKKLIYSVVAGYFLVVVVIQLLFTNLYASAKERRKNKDSLRVFVHGQMGGDLAANGSLNAITTRSQIQSQASITTLVKHTDNITHIEANHETYDVLDINGPHRRNTNLEETEQFNQSDRQEPNMTLAQVGESHIGNNTTPLTHPNTTNLDKANATNQSPLEDRIKSVLKPNACVGNISNTTLPSPESLLVCGNLHPANPARIVLYTTMYYSGDSKMFIFWNVVNQWIGLGDGVQPVLYLSDDGIHKEERFIAHACNIGWVIFRVSKYDW